MTNESSGSPSIALFGAAGAVGHALGATLDERGIAYRVVGRNADTLAREFPNAQAARADFFNGDGVAEAAQGVETIVYAAGAPYTEFYKHPIMVRHALDAAQKAAVKRFVHVAPVYSYGPARTIPVAETQPLEPNTHKGRFRLEQEQAVLERNSPSFRTVVVRMPDFYGPNADLSYANTFMREALAGKTALWLGSLDADREFIYVPDAADPLLRLAARDDLYGRYWNVGGTTIKARDFIQRVFAAAGKPAKYRRVPKIAAQGIGLFVPLIREVSEMYYLFDSGFVLDDSALQSALGGYPKTPVTAGIERTIAWLRSHPQENTSS
jgi:nucleoside-diphosphate-sugar epimerase